MASAVLLGVLVALAGVTAAATPAGEELEENFGLRWLFGVRGPVAPPRDVVIVAIDERSARDLNLPERPSAWPRSLHAEVVRYLAKAGATSITFDLTFDAVGMKPEQDQEFAEAMRSAGNVLLAESIRRETLRLPDGLSSSAANAVIESRGTPIETLAQAAHGSAPFMLPKESRVDTYWTFLDDERLVPTLPVLTLQAFMSEPRRWRPGPGEAVTVRTDVERILFELRAGPESRYLNFYGPPRTIVTVPYSDVIAAARDTGLRGAVDNLFRGKAIFIGYAASTPAGQDRLRDDYRTVYSHSSGLDLSGVEIAATAFANLLEGTAVRPVGPGWQLAIVALWGLGLGVVCRLARPVLATLIVGAACSGYLWFVLERFSDASLWLPSVVPVAAQASLALFAGVWLRYRDTHREREGIKRAFGFFLPRAVVDQLSRNLGPMTRGNHVLFGACLSTDAEKYTSIAEQTEPGRLGELMNEYYEQLFVPVERSKGVVADVVGDSMVAVWARTSSDIDVRRSACLATLEIARSLDEFNRSGDSDRPPMLTRFGLHSGDMLFGNIGASEHYEYRAVGDIVNTASRIQGLNKVLGTHILASAETVQGLDELTVRPLGSFLLAGKARPVSIVELIRARSDSADADPVRNLAAFALALAAFEERRWSEAATLFARILDVGPDDGPTRFYAAQCDRLRVQPPDSAWTPTIRIDSK